MVNGFLIDKQGRVNDFFIEKYHSQFDDPDTYDEEMTEYNIKLYGCLALFLIGQPLWLLDFSAQIHQMEKGLDHWMNEQFFLEGKQFTLALKELRHASDNILKKLTTLNERTHGNNTLNRSSQLAVNQYVLHIFKRWQDLFLRLDWSDTPIVGHQHYVKNCTQLEEAAAHLREGQGEAALEHLSFIEDEHISRYFSRAVVEHFTNQVISPYRKDNQLWGTGRIVDSLDLYDIINTIQLKCSKEKEHDWQVEISQLESHLNEQKRKLKKTLIHEMEGLNEIQLMLEDVQFEKHINGLLMDVDIDEP